LRTVAGGAQRLTEFKQSWGSDVPFEHAQEILRVVVRPVRFTLSLAATDWMVAKSFAVTTL
jgi:hypothetical protein